MLRIVVATALSVVLAGSAAAYCDPGAQVTRTVFTEKTWARLGVRLRLGSRRAQTRWADMTIRTGSRLALTRKAATTIQTG